MAKKTNSIEELIEEWAKSNLTANGVKFKRKTQSINTEIEDSLKSYPSKDGGSGGNFPDIKFLLDANNGRKIPVMIEVKGKKGLLAKYSSAGEIEMNCPNGNPNYKIIQRYAVNGAVHYAYAILKLSATYTKEVIAIGVNGYYDSSNNLVHEMGVYYVGQSNFYIPQKIDDYTDFSFLSLSKRSELLDKIDNIGLSPAEIEEKTKMFEDSFEKNLKNLNQDMEDKLDIAVGNRVKLITGLIMAGLGVPRKVYPLDLIELKGEKGEKTNDGIKLLNKIEDFLKNRNLPDEKIKIIVNSLKNVFLYSHYQDISDDSSESKLKIAYSRVLRDIIPFFTSKQHLDFTGKLFNTLNDWVSVPDGAKNDVVLTPRYVTDFMAKLAKINKDSYVWDYTLGSAGFLISSMKLMIRDATASIRNPKERDKKIKEIKQKQLLGIEKLPDIYLLAVLNMILMDDGSCNIILDNSLNFDGKYQQGKNLEGKRFPANVFLLNPPYSAAGKGFVFVDKALKQMKSGRAVILIQENAGSGNGLPYTKNILKKNTLLASIHMSDIFFGKANVQTAIYIFDVGTAHDPRQVVKFLDFSVDGYNRQNRRKSSQSVNVRDTDHALERYEEAINLVLYGRRYLHYYSDKEYIEDTISLDGNDWTFKQHQKFNTIPSNFDFCSILRDRINWKITLNAQERVNVDFSQVDDIKQSFINGGGEYTTINAGKIFSVSGNPQLDKGVLKTSSNGNYPYFTRTEKNNGILEFVEYYDNEHLIKGNSIAVGLIKYKFFYIQHDFYAGQFTKNIIPLFDGFNETIAMYFISWFNKYSDVFSQSGLVRDFNKVFNNMKIEVPYKDGEIALSHITELVKGVEQIELKRIEDEIKLNIQYYKENHLLI